MPDLDRRMPIFHSKCHFYENFWMENSSPCLCIQRGQTYLLNSDTQPNNLTYHSNAAAAGPNNLIPNTNLDSHLANVCVIAFVRPFVFFFVQSKSYPLNNCIFHLATFQSMIWRCAYGLRL